MANPLFDALGGAQQAPGGMGNMIKAFEQFKRTFTGDPQHQVQQLLNSGQMSQQQYNQLLQMAQNLTNVLK